MSFPTRGKAAVECGQPPMPGTGEPEHAGPNAVAQPGRGSAEEAGMSDRAAGGRRGLWLRSMALLALPVVMVACGGGNPTSSAGAGAAGTTSAAGTAPAAGAGGSFPVTKDPKAAALLPAGVAGRGTLTVATDATYAPNEFVAPTGGGIQGMDVDLGRAIGQVLGLKVTFVNAGFDTIIPGLASGKFDLGMSSFTDTRERQKTVDFVTYFSAGTGFYVKATNGIDVTGLDSLCGHRVAAERGTTQAADATAAGKRCTAAGKPTVNLDVFPDQNGANLALASGRVDVVMADSPVAAYAVKQSNGQFALSTTTYGTAPYGIAIPRPPSAAPGTAPLSKPLLAAVQHLVATGTYRQILDRWGVQQGAITSSAINAAAS